MSSLFNTLSRFVIVFLQRSNHLISWLQLPYSVVLEPKKGKSVTASTFSPFICHEVMGPDAMILVLFFFLILSFTFSLSYFRLIKRLLNSFSLSTFKMISSAYLRLLIFPPAILSLAYNSTSPAFHMMCSVYKLNKKGDNKRPHHTPFSILNQSIVPYKDLTVAS